MGSVRSSGAVFDLVSRVIVALLAALCLVGPMFALASTKYNEPIKRVNIAAIVVFLFAVITSAGSSASNHEVFMMTAAYAAVVVVFVGETLYV